MKTPRNHFKVEKISEYEALIIGGIDNNNNVLSSCEIINIADSTIIPAKNLIRARCNFTSQQDKFGNIYVIGGNTSDLTNTISEVEKYDLISHQWSIVGSLITSRAHHSSIFLNDSLILIVAGIGDGDAPISSCEIFNINTGNSKLIKDYPFAVNQHSLEKNTNGEVISICGRLGNDNSPRLNSIYRYDFSADNWLTSGILNANLANVKALKLPNSKVFLGGGASLESPIKNSADYYTENGFISYFVKSSFNRNMNSLELFDDSTVVNFGGYDEKDQNIADCEWINTNTAQKVTMTKLNLPRRSQESITLMHPRDPSKKAILCIGGVDKLNSSALTSIEILMEDIQINKNPPRISSQYYECNKFIYIVEDINNIDSILLDKLKSKNCSFSLNTILPSKKVEVTVYLLDPTKDGYFYIINKCNKSANEVIIKSSIFSNPVSKSILFTDQTDADDNIMLNTELYGKIESKYLHFENKSIYDITINSANFKNKYSYSFPISQFPKVVKASSTDSLNYWLEFNLVGEILDTLVFDIDSCSRIEKSILAFGEKEDFTGKNSCVSNLKLITQAIEKNKPFIINSFPNPAGLLINIEIASKNDDYSIYFENLLGELIPIQDFELFKNSEYVKTISIKTDILNTGIYKIILKNENEILSTNILILK